MSITVNRGKRGTSIHAKGADAQALFDALTGRSAEGTKPPAEAAPAEPYVDSKFRASEARALQDQAQFQSMTRSTAS